MKHSVQLFAFLFITIQVFTSCVFSNKPVIQGNHQLVNQRVDIDNYDELVLNIPGEVFYQQFSDSAPYLQIHTDENILKVLDFKVQDNRLIIDVKKDSLIRPSKLTVYTCSHNINKINLNGSGKLCLKGEVNSNDLNLKITGSGKLITDSLLCNALSLNITGSGNARLTGASNESTYKITGSGDINAFDFFVQNLKCGITGSGNIEALVSNKLEVNITGSGDITYRGEPQSIDKKITGSGKIRQEK